MSENQKPIYTALAELYDHIMDDVDYAYWAEYVDDLMHQFHPNPRYITELSCGTASLSIELSQLGDYQLQVCDASESMVSIAEQKIKDLSLDIPSFVSAFDNLEFSEGYQIKMIEEVTDFQFCTTIISYNTDNSVDSNSNSIIGTWAMHSIYDLNQSTDEWESVDMLDIGGGAPFIIHFNCDYGYWCLPARYCGTNESSSGWFSQGITSL